MMTRELNGYTVKELTVGQMRRLRTQAADNPDELQYRMAAACVHTPDGQPLGLEALDAMPLSQATPLLEAVADVNAPAGSGVGNG